MKVPLLMLISALATLISGCASTQPIAEHTVILLTGRVTARSDVRSVDSGPGAYLPGMGGAVGGLVYGLLKAFETRTKYIIYDVKPTDGPTNFFQADQDVLVGACVEVVTKPDTVEPSKREPGDVSLRLSSKCES
jgi:hypothetical protein